MGRQVLSFVTLAADALAVLVLAGSLPAIAAALRVPLDVAGLLFAANGAGFVLAVPVAGLLADRYGKWTLTACSSLVLAIGLLLLAASRRLPSALLAAALTGAGSGSVESGLSALFPEFYPGREGYANNFGQVFFSVGACLGPLWLLAPGWSWRTRLGTCGAAFLLLAAALRAQRPGPRQPRRTAAARDHPVALGPWLRALRAVLGTPGVRLSVAALLLYTGVEVTLWDWLYALVSRSGGAAAVWGALQLSGFWCAMGVGRLLSAHLTERVALPVLIRGAVLLGMPTLLLGLLLPSRPAAWGAMILCGLALACIWPSLVAHAQRRHGEAALLTALLVAAGGAGALLIPAAFGFAAAALGLPAAAVGLAVLLAPVAILPSLGPQQAPVAPAWQSGG